MSFDLRFKPFAEGGQHHVERPVRRSAPTLDDLYYIWRADIFDLDRRLDRPVRLDDLIVTDPRFDVRIECNRYCTEFPIPDDTNNLPELYARWQQTVALCELQAGRPLSAVELQTFVPVRER